MQRVQLPSFCWSISARFRERFSAFAAAAVASASGSTIAMGWAKSTAPAVIDTAEVGSSLITTGFTTQANEFAMAFASVPVPTSAVLLFVLCFWGDRAAALRGTDEVSVSNEYQIWDTFGFLPNGTVDLRFTIVEPVPQSNFTMYLIGIYDSKLAEFSAFLPEASSEFCNLPDDPKYSELPDFVVELGPNDFNGSVYKPISSNGQYDVLVFSCDPSPPSIKLEISYNFLNPDGEALSTTQIPLKSATIAFAAAWLCLAFVWSVNRFGNAALTNGMFHVVGVLPLVGVLKSLVYNLFWEDLSKTGVVNGRLLYGELALFALADSVLMLAFMLLATGWCVSRIGLSPSEWRSVSAYAVFYFMCKTGWELTLSIAFSFLLLAAYMLIIFWVLQHTRMNMEMLFLRLHMMQPVVSEELGQRLTNQFTIIQRFRGIVVSFVCFVVLVRMWASIGLRQQPWAVYVLEELLTVFLVAYLMYLLRLSRHYLYTATLETHVTLLGNMGDGMTDEANVEVLTAPVVVVSNPGSAGSLMVATPWSYDTVCEPPSARPAMAPASVRTEPTVRPSTTASAGAVEADVLVDVHLDEPEGEEAGLLARP